MNGTADMEWIDSFQKVQEAVERLAAAREAVGPGVGIGIDLHGRVHKSMAKILVKEYEPFHPMFIEEPVLPENNEALPEIAHQSSIPMLPASACSHAWSFKNLLASGAGGHHSARHQPLRRASGNYAKSAMAEAYDVAVAPHCPLARFA
jgi:galactonate dehydratase